LAFGVRAVSLTEAESPYFIVCILTGYFCSNAKNKNKTILVLKLILVLVLVTFSRAHFSFIRFSSYIHFRFSLVVLVN